jgi:hypothetical protein
MSRRISSNERNLGLVTEEVVERALLHRGWTVFREPRYGSLRPDFVASAPSGDTYVIEIKSGRNHRPTTFTDVAQVRTYEKAVRAANPGKNVRAIFVTDGQVSSSVKEMSQDLGISILDVANLDEISDQLDILLPA